MKRLSLLTTTVLLTIGAWASDSQLPLLPLHTEGIVKREVSRTPLPFEDEIRNSPVAPKPETTTRVLGARKADSSSSLEGLWTFSLGDYYFEDSILGTIEKVFTASIDGKYVWFEPTSPEMLPMVAEYDPSISTLIFQKMSLGSNGQYFIYQEPFIYDWLTQTYNYRRIYARYDEALGEINFAELNAIDWKAYEKENGSTPVGSFYIFDLEGALIEGGVEDNWISIGNATLYDGWVLPGFGINQMENPYEVPMEQNIINPALYRLVDPYHRGPIADRNISTTKGSILFDTSDADHVLFYKRDAGFANADMGIYQFFCYNLLGAYVQFFTDYTPAQLIKQLEGKVPFTTLKDGVMTLSYIIDEDGINNDTNFGYQLDPAGFYTWEMWLSRSVDMSSKIIFPEKTGAVGTIESENAMEARYYNLQGNEVRNPAPGQILIKVLGNEASKIIFR